MFNSLSIFLYMYYFLQVTPEHNSFVPDEQTPVEKANKFLEAIMGENSTGAEAAIESKNTENIHSGK